jgi:hypothetical protein
MLDELRRRSSPPQDLFGIIAHVRNRWRMKLALRGAVNLMAVAFGLFVLAAYGMQTLRFTSTSIIAARIALPLGFIAAVLWFVVRPLRRKVSDEQVALYLEEHEPSLQATLLSAVETSRNGSRRSPRRWSARWSNRRSRRASGWTPHAAPIRRR